MKCERARKHSLTYTPTTFPRKEFRKIPISQKTLDYRPVNQGNVTSDTLQFTFLLKFQWKKYIS